ncbi:MAG: flagellar protein FliL [Nocardioidaceae bacterium]|jgi:flagellar FliL protein|nr:flagellar protein FliL [Nocardioidaceae bacterium]
MTVTTMPATGAAEGAEPAKKGGKKKLLIILVAVLAIGGGAYWFVLKPHPAGPPSPGVVVPLEPIQVNLAAGHYLKIGLALQLTKGTKEVDGSQALDATIELFSGRDMSQLTKPAEREKLKHQLVATLEKKYDGAVMDAYFTDFVTQ